jgi:hypothetical protein
MALAHQGDFWLKISKLGIFKLGRNQGVAGAFFIFNRRRSAAGGR